MKIGILSREYPPLTHIGGLGTFSATAAGLLAGHGHEIHVICNGPEFIIEKSTNLNIHRIPMLPHHFPKGKWLYLFRKLYRKYLPHYLDAITWARTAAKYIDNLNTQEEFEIWEMPETAGEGALLNSHKIVLTAPRKGFRIICRIHSSWMNNYTENFFEKFLMLRLQKKSCLLADRLISPTFFMGKNYVPNILKVSKSVQVSRNPIQHWPSPIDWAEKKMTHILFVGRIEHRKGLQTLLKALDEITSNGNFLTLRIVGSLHRTPNQLDSDCQKMFYTYFDRTHKGSHHSLEYAGPCSHSEMAQHYDWAGILVIPSLMENYPYVALEGLSRGCFLIGSNIGGIPEIIDSPERGMLFDVENSTHLAEKIRECMQNAEQISAKMPRVAKEIESEFDLETCYLRLINDYSESSIQRQKE